MRLAIVNGEVKRAVCRVASTGWLKDKTFLNILAVTAVTRMGNYAYYFPTATLGRKALWDNIDNERAGCALSTICRVKSSPR